MAGYKLDLGGGAFKARAARREEMDTDLSAPFGERHFAAGLEATARANADAAARPPLPSLALDFPAAIDLASLDGSNGFRIDGIAQYDGSGRSVASAGDVNGDGFDDIVIGAGDADPDGDILAGESYVVFGHAGGFAASLDPAALDGSNGFRIDGIDPYDRSGFSVASAGDVNGDGFGDIIVGAYGGDPGGDLYAGESYVVFGKLDGFAASLDLSSLDGSNGFRLDGIDESDSSGSSVALAGDVNGDGFDDIVIGAYHADPGGDGNAGESYVVFGHAGGFAASLDLASLDGGNGFRLDGIDVNDQSGVSVASAGDVNGDGFDDIIIGAYGGDPGGDSFAGESYVVFGKSGGFAASLDLASLDGSDGFRLDGIDVNDLSGLSVSSAGDVNSDGFDDIVIGARGGDPSGDSAAGESYVVFGHAGGFAASLDLSTLNGSNGFRIDGIDVNDRSGYSVASAGDVNGDGFDDIIIGARYADAGGDFNAGESYVVFGHAGGFAASLDLASLNGSNGFRLHGIDTFDNSGSSVSAAGDVDGDGFGDILIGANAADSYAGESYVIFGRKPTNGVTRIGSDIGQFIAGGLGDDVVEGRGGDDSLRGDIGDDLLRGDEGDDTIDAGKGDDTVEGGSGADRLAGGADFDSLKGGSGADTLTGGAGEDTLDGGSSADTTSYADAALGVRADLQTPSANTSDAFGDIYISIENLTGSRGNDVLRGNGAANVLDGGNKNDQLQGRDGADTLIGGIGRDNLTGGAGDDRFTLEFAVAKHRDAILDFGGNDEIALLGSAFGQPPGALLANRFTLGTAATDVKHRIIYDQATGELFFDRDGTGAQAQVLIATLANTAPLAAGDFIVI